MHRDIIFTGERYQENAETISGPDKEVIVRLDPQINNLKMEDVDNQDLESTADFQ